MTLFYLARLISII